MAEQGKVTVRRFRSSDRHWIHRWTRALERCVLSWYVTFLFGCSLVLLGVSTSGEAVDDLPMRNQQIILAIGAGVVGIGAALYYRNLMTPAHVVMGVTLILLSVLRGAAFVYHAVDRGESDAWDLITNSTPTWVWVSVFFAALVFWGIAHREHRRRRALHEFSQIGLNKQRMRELEAAGIDIDEILTVEKK